MCLYRLIVFLQLQNALTHKERPEHKREAGGRQAFETPADVVVQPLRDVAAVEQQRGGFGALGSQASQRR